MSFETEKTSILGFIICLTSKLPNETIPFKIFFSSFEVSLLSVSSRASDNLSTDKLVFLKTNFF